MIDMKTHKKKIAVIGAGQIGSRHLQGLAQIDFSAELAVVDPSEKSLARARDRFEEMPHNEMVSDIRFLESIQSLPEHLDLAVVATTSNVRKEIVIELLQCCSVENLLLEKVVFQSERDFLEIGELLDKYEISAWVNCVRRVTPAYHAIKELLVDSGIASFNFTFGDAFGLGSNAVHFLDCMAFLCDCDEYGISENKLNNEIISSKRSGFVEFSGSFAGKFDNNISFEVNALKDSDESTIFEITSDAMKIKVYEGAGSYTVEKIDEGEPASFPFSIPYQSSLTNITAKEILHDGKCDLPTYEVSKKIHIPLLRLFSSHLERVKGGSFPQCPIT